MPQLQMRQTGQEDVRLRDGRKEREWRVACLVRLVMLRLHVIFLLDLPLRHPNLFTPAEPLQRLRVFRFNLQRLRKRFFGDLASNG